MRIRFHTYEFDRTDIHVRTLRNRQEFEDDDKCAQRIGITSANWSLFGVVWQSGEILAREMATHEVTGLRILEIGCGIALASIVLATRQQNITATDHHPEAHAFLKFNADLNGLPPIPFVRSGWAQQEQNLGKYDLLIGSDLLYEKSNVDLLANFIDRHAEKRCEVLLIDPNRGLQGQFSKRMVHMGYTASPRIKITDNALPNYKGCVLGYTRS